MGIEYIAKTQGKVSSEQVGDFVSEFTSHPGWEVIQRHNGRICFMFAGTAPRANWPEDFCLHFTTDEFYIVFDSGTREQKNSVMNFIHQTLSSKGIAIVLEEP